jgi:hypothetical protein
MLEKTEITKLKIDDLKQFKNNPKIHSDLIEKSIKELGNLEIITVDEDNTILSGHGRVKALKKLGVKELDVNKVYGLTEEEKEKYLLIANQSTIEGGFDDELLKAFGKDILDWSGIDVIGQNDTYSKKIDSPIYETSNIKPQIKELFDDIKTKELIKKINLKIQDKETKDFLLNAAYRFTVFNFQKIADFYSNEKDREIKEIMEEMALIIIDFNKAIELGYINLEKNINKILENE